METTYKTNKVQCEICGVTRGTTGGEEYEQIADFGICFKCAHARYVEDSPDSNADQLETTIGTSL